MNSVITISREYGSGGREIGMLAAQKLGVPFYDKELVTKLAESGEFSPEILKRYDETSTLASSSFFQVRNMVSFYHQPLTTRIYLSQCNLIQKLAEAGPCVIVGRCSDSVLDGKCISVFIHGDLESRIARKMGFGKGESAEEVKKRILDIDKQRKRYYELHTDRKWGDLKNYHLTIDSTGIPTEVCAEIIVQYAKGWDLGGHIHGSAER